MARVDQRRNKPDHKFVEGGTDPEVETIGYGTIRRQKRVDAGTGQEQSR
jgi:hypothetical protein